MAEAHLARADAQELPCIRCGECAPVCPAHLLPYRLLGDARADRLDRARRDGVLDCVECGACDRACPSRIPLLDHFRWLASELRAQDIDRARADAARERFEARRLRLAAEEVERTAQAAARREQTASSDAVQAALERARARKRSKEGDA